MPEAKEITYAALITIELPGMRYPATVTVSLRPPDTIEVAPGRVKPLRDCSLAELEAFAEALEADIWEQHRSALLGDLADRQAQLKITVLDESGQPLALEKDRILEHAITLHNERQATDVQQAGSADEEKEAAESSEDDSQEAAQTEEQPDATTDTVAAEISEEVAPAESPATTVQPREQETETEEPETEAPAAAEKAAQVPEQPSAEAEKAPEEVVADAEDKAEAVAKEAAEPEAPVRPQPAPTQPRIAGLRRPLGHPTPAAVDILINETAFRDAQAHALSSLEREVAGMLIGPRPEKQPDGRYVVHVSDVIIAKHTRMHGASVTYTPESWRYVTDKLAERYPNEEAVIVGWYHTHPGFGIFLSGMDLFIHQNFFTQKWHIALVLDPLARKSGFFCWDRRQSEVQAYDFPWPQWARGRW